MIAGYVLIAVCGGLAGCTLLWSLGPAWVLLSAPACGSGAVLIAAVVAVRSRRHVPSWRSGIRWRRRDGTTVRSCFE
jgi:hypothetical protein